MIELTRDNFVKKENKMGNNDRGRRLKEIAIIIVLLVSIAKDPLYFFWPTPWNSGIRSKRNLEDISEAKSFYSEKINKNLLDKVYKNMRLKNKGFTSANKSFKEDQKGYINHGKAYMLDSKGKKIKSFILFESSKEYVLYMRHSDFAMEKIK